LGSIRQPSGRLHVRIEGARGPGLPAVCGRLVQIRRALGRRHWSRRRCRLLPFVHVLTRWRSRADDLVPVARSGLERARSCAR
jgi:hypothetical protein